MENLQIVDTFAINDQQLSHRRKCLYLWRSEPANVKLIRQLYTTNVDRMTGSLIDTAFNRRGPHAVCLGYRPHTVTQMKLMLDSTTSRF